MNRSRSSRRRVLTALGAGAATALAGCSDVVGSDAPPYEDGTIDDVEAENRSAAETTAAESLAETEPNQSVTELSGLSLEDHEFVLEDGFKGPTVQGTATNTGEDRIQTLEARVRVYDDAGTQLGRYLDTGGDLDGGQSWSFEVVLLESPSDLDSYDVAVLGTPG